MMRVRKRRMAEINVVPYIDVMLVLLVIFMITAPLLTQGVNVNLPQAKAKAMAEDKTPVIVSVNQSGDYFLNLSTTPNSPLPAQQIAVQVAARIQLAKQKQEPLPPVYVKADRDVNYGKVVQAMVMLQQAGAENIGLVTDPSTPAAQ